MTTIMEWRPELLALSFYLLFALLYFEISRLFRSALINSGYAEKDRSRRLWIFRVVLILLVIYTAVLAYSGILMHLGMPPRLPLLVILPVFLSAGIFLYRYRKHPTLHAVPLHRPIAYQSFRILIELIFYGMMLEKILPDTVTFEGYNLDILIGFTAPLIAWLAYRNRAPKWLLISWNIAGILVVGNAAFTFITSFYFPQVWGQNEAMISFEFVQLPYLLLPAFFMPSAVFAHVYSLIQLTQKVAKK